jgi:hypothetical protein
MQTTSNTTKALWALVAFLALFLAAQSATEKTAIYIAIPTAALIGWIVFSYKKQPSNERQQQQNPQH